MRQLGKYNIIMVRKSSKFLAKCANGAANIGIRWGQAEDAAGAGAPLLVMVMPGICVKGDMTWVAGATRCSSYLAC